MTRKFLAVLAVLAIGVAFAFAEAQPPATLKGKVASIEGVKVQITVDGEKPAWVKKGAGVKVKGGQGKVIDVAATTVTINTRKAPEMKVGEELTLEKGPAAPAGC
jgi:hypothetical protein